MATLAESLTSPEKKAAVVNDCCIVIDQEVSDKGGLSGMAVKAGYAVVKGIKPGFIKHVVEELLPEFASALDPLYAEAKSKSEAVGAYFARNSGRAADALLAITDGKARQSKNALLRSTYERLRGAAKKHVEQAVPRVGRLVEKHAG